MSENNGFIYIGENENSTTVWQYCGPNSPWAERFHVSGYEGVLPFLVPGDTDAAANYMKTEGVQEAHLLKGILYGLYEFDQHPKPWHQKKDRETLLFLLDVLRKGFKFDNQETMILTIANNVREEYGNATSRIILEVGNTLMPESSKIKSDLICNLWEVVCKRAESNEILIEIITLVHQIDFSEILPFAKEIVCYYGLCALILLKEENYVELYMEKNILPNVKDEQLLDAINALMESPNDFTPEDLRIVHSE